MKFIAHRGLTEGEGFDTENHPNTVGRALDRGFDAEVDVWLVDGKWRLGHDGPQHDILESFLFMPGLWLHCKNLEAMFQLSTLNENDGTLNYFWHQYDNYTLTSQGYIWTHVNSIITTEKSVLVLAYEYDWAKQDLLNSYGLCSKNIKEVKQRITL